MSDWFIGIDGGGTNTRAVVLDDAGRELARVRGSAALADPLDPEAVALPIAQVACSAADAAGLALPCTALWAGIAGVGRETVRAPVQRAVEREGIAGRVHVGTDSQAAFHGAFGEGPGILLVAGTGSVARGRNESGREVRVGGWGSLLGDEGSGYWVGLECLRSVVRAADGRGGRTRLTDGVLASLGIDAPDALVTWAAAADKAQVAALVPLVVDASRAGDAVADDILARAIEDLSAHVLTLGAALAPWSSAPRVGLTGGLLQPGGPLRLSMEAALSQHRLRLVGHEPDPAVGAARLAQGLTGATRR
jgi:glucosamine kinase